MQNDIYYDSPAIGKRLRHLRKQQMRGTQAHVAEELHIAVGTYNNMERGKYTMSVEMLMHVATYYGVTPDYLLTGRIANTGDMQAIKELLSQLDHTCKLLHKMIK